MTRGVLRAAIFVCAVLGCVHIGLTAQNHDAGSVEAVWFAGTGFALLFLAAFNWAALARPHPDSLVRRFAIAADVIAALGGIGASYIVREPQAYVLVLTFATMALTGALQHRALRTLPTEKL